MIKFRGIKEVNFYLADQGRTAVKSLKELEQQLATDEKYIIPRRSIRITDEEKLKKLNIALGI